MQCGLFTELQCPEGQQEPQLYEGLLEEITQADELGFHAVWLAELHHHRRFSILSAPLLVASAAAQRTRRIRLGIAVNILPLHQPIRLAEEGAVLDVLSHGRLDFGVGRGHPFPGVYESFQIPPDESRPRFDEALDVLLGAWTQEPFAYHGRFFQMPPITVVPRPIQRPHPPLFVAAGSPETYAATGRRGLGLLIPGHVQPTDFLREHLVAYRQAGEAAGHRDRLKVTLLLPIYVAEKQRQAEEDPEASVMYYFQVLGELLSGPLPQSYQRYGESRRRVGALTYADILGQRAIFGEPSYCIERIQELEETLDIQQIMGWMNIGGMPHARVLHSMRLFAERVLPAVS